MGCVWSTPPGGVGELAVSIACGSSDVYEMIDKKGKAGADLSLILPEAVYRGDVEIVKRILVYTSADKLSMRLAMEMGNQEMIDVLTIR